MRAFLILLLPILHGCFTPPVVRPVREKEIDLARYPTGSELVSLTVESDERLRGVFVPSDPGAPVVLHLLESGGTATRGNFGPYGYGQFAELRDLGLASLVVDYRGVGASDGERSPEYLGDDARAMFAEAARRAGGEERVVLRSTSLGTLAASGLIEAGAQPAAWILVSPVRGESVTENVACRRYGKLVSLLAWGVFCAAGDSDLLRAIEQSPCPLLLALGDRDDYLSRRERELIEAAVMAKPNHVRVPMEGLDHVDVSFEAYSVLGEERALYERIFPDRVDTSLRLDRIAADARSLPGSLELADALQAVATRWWFDPPSLALDVAALSPQVSDEALSAFVDFLRAQDTSRIATLEELPDDARRALFDYSDPGGPPLDPRELLSLARFADFDRSWTSGRRYAEHCAWRIGESQLQRRAYLPRPKGEIRGIKSARSSERRIDVWEGELGSDAPARLSHPDVEYRRRAIRRLLYKAALIPDRVTRLEDGKFGIEIFVDGRWQVAYRGLRSPRPRTSASASRNE